MKRLARTVSATLLALLIFDLWMLSLNIFTVRAVGTIFIRSDGTLDPATASISSIDGVTYTFTNSVSDEIVVEKSNIIIDGAGFPLQGTRTLNSTGLLLAGVSNVLIRGMNIISFFSAIKLEWSSDIEIIGNNLTNNDFGVWLHESTRITMAANNIQGGWAGINLAWSRNSDVQHNKIIGNEHGILLHWSLNNDVSENILEDNEVGISLAWSANNNLESNNMTNAAKRGAYGIRLHSSARNTIIANLMVNSLHGVKLIYESTENSLVRNNVTSNFYGIYVSYASNNTIHHNRFVGNTNQVKSYKSANTWDDGYPSGGNYWSDYRGIDEKSGIGQDQPGSDEIGDTPYIIDGTNLDRYPIVGEIHQPAFIVDLRLLYVVLAVAVVASLGLGFFVIRRRKKPKCPEASNCSNDSCSGHNMSLNWKLFSARMNDKVDS